MKKYIMTKLGYIYEVIRENDYEYIVDSNLRLRPEMPISFDDVEKESDSILGLCDYVISFMKENGKELPWTIEIRSDPSDFYELYHLNSPYEYSVYGAVHSWGDCISFVAKMNEKGEFELL